jgi:hypothetical protein
VGRSLFALWGDGRGVVIAVGQNGTVVRSADGGLSFAEIASGTRVNLWAVGGGGGTDVGAVGDDGTIALISTAGGTLWSAG